jgi:hypothetical protein
MLAGKIGSEPEQPAYGNNGSSHGDSGRYVCRGRLSLEILALYSRAFIDMSMLRPKIDNQILLYTAVYFACHGANPTFFLLNFREETETAP